MCFIVVDTGRIKGTFLNIHSYTSKNIYITIRKELLITIVVFVSVAFFIVVDDICNYLLWLPILYIFALRKQLSWLLFIACWDSPSIIP